MPVVIKLPNNDVNLQMDIDVESVTASIKQLVTGSGKFMQEANTFEQAEERILHLEENDDQFHK